MNRKLLFVALASALAITACKPQAPAEPATDAAPAVSAPAEPAPVAVESAPAASPAEVPFDIKGFAGTFVGGGTKVNLNPDGTYTFGGETAGDGTWTAEDGGKTIRLDPNSKSEADRVYTVVSHDQLDLTDAATPQSLKREGSKQ